MRNIKIIMTKSKMTNINYSSIHRRIDMKMTSDIRRLIKINDLRYLLAILYASDSMWYYIAYRTATNRRWMHYLVAGGTGVFQFLMPSLGYAVDKSVPWYDTTPAWHEYTRETAVASRKEANGRPADQPQIPLRRWLLAISRAGHAQRVRREKSVIPTPCYHSRQWLVEAAKAPFRGYQTPSLATQTYTYNRRNWLRRRVRKLAGKLVDAAFVLYLHLDFSVTWRRVGRGNDWCESIKSCLKQIFGPWSD